MRASRIALALGCLALPCSAQGIEGKYALDLLQPRTSAPHFPLSPLASAWKPAQTLPVPDTAAGVRREALDTEGEESLLLDELPGGIVFGLVATTDFSAGEARLELVDRELRILADGRELTLPPIDPTLLSSCMRFAARSRPDEVLVDIRFDGTVVLAPEFIDTSAGSALIRCDHVPLERVSAHRVTKSVLLDREVRARFLPEEGRVILHAELEARFFVPGRAVRGLDSARRIQTWTPDRATHEGELAEGARIAGWIGFLRWARQADPEGFAAVQQALESVPTVFAPTPRWIDLATLWAARSRPEGRVADWMRAHREQQLQNLAHASGN